MIIAYIGVGANLNNPKQQVIKSFKALEKLPHSSLISQSSLYLSPPMGPQDQDMYINAVAKLQTSLEAIELLDHLQAIEKNHGRVRKSERWGARTLDLDLLLYGNKKINGARLTVPHYGLKQRAFVLIPLLELEPLLVLPDNSILSEQIEKIGSQGVKKL